MYEVEKFQKTAVELFENGYSCSEALIKAAYECNVLEKESDISVLTQIASPFGGGAVSNGCICGALAGAQLIIGCLIGRNDLDCPNDKILNVSRALVDGFKQKGHITCCRASVPGFCESHEERMHKCSKTICDVIELLEKDLLSNIKAKQQV